MGDIICKPIMKTCTSVTSIDELDFQSTKREPIGERYKLLTPPPILEAIQFTDL
jgi:hypothetical protein